MKRRRVPQSVIGIYPRDFRCASELRISYNGWSTQVVPTILGRRLSKPNSGWMDSRRGVQRYGVEVGRVFCRVVIHGDRFTPLARSDDTCEVRHELDTWSTGTLRRPHGEPTFQTMRCGAPEVSQYKRSDR